MARHLRIPLVIACAFIFAVCGVDTSIDPGPTPPVEPPPRETLTTFLLRPDSVEFEQGFESPFWLIIRDQRGEYPVVPPVITYSSSSPLIASVSRTGLVTAMGPGVAIISAATRVGDSTFISSSRVFVRSPTIRDSLVLEAKSYGWAPSPGHIVAGGKVEWKPGTIDGAGVPVTVVYLMKPDYSVIDSVDVSRGPAVRRFNSTGLVRYCSNACWDPPEHGVIIVH